MQRGFIPSTLSSFKNICQKPYRERNIIDKIKKEVEINEKLKRRLKLFS